MEPGQSTYLPFLKPLLEAPGSRYHLRDWDDWLPWTPEPYLSDKLLADLANTTTTDGRTDSLLIIANLGYGWKQRVRGSIPSHARIFQYLNCVRFKQGFHTSGSVRLLLWMNDSDKRAILPRTVFHRRKLSLEVEMTCYVEEIVGGLASQTNQRREDFLDTESSKRIAKEMARRNIQIPFNRQDETQRMISKDLLLADGKRTASTEKRLDTADTHRAWHEDLKQMEEDFRAGKFSKFTGEEVVIETESKHKQPRKTQKDFTPEYRRFHQLQTTFKSQNKKKQQLDSFLEQEEAMNCLESDMYHQKHDKLQMERKMKQLKQRAENLKSQLEIVSKVDREAFWYNSDNRKAANQNPPLLMWDRRRAEPLIAREDEFHSPTQLALLDFQPRFSNAFPMTTTEAASFQLIMGPLFSNGCNTLKYLDSLAPGAAEAIAPQVPALRDPQRGGRHNLSDLRVRCFTPEMVYGIAQAWENWPFKPPLTDLISRSPGDFKDPM